MENLFKKEECLKFVQDYAMSCPKELALRVFTSRLIGSDTSLVLHGGGNTSVKLKLEDIFGQERDVIFVKGSGWDLATIKPEGFTGLNMEPLQKFRALDSLSTEEMYNQLNIHKISASAPSPSVEALLHLFLPHKYVDHTHADSILILTNQKEGREIVTAVLGDKVAVIPYIMSGLPLAKAVIQAYEDNPDIDAVVVMNHGIFTFAEDAEQSYRNMTEYVIRAKAYIGERAGDFSPGSEIKQPAPAYDESSPRGKSDLVRCVQFIRGACARPEPDGKLQRLLVETRRSPILVGASLSEEARNLCRSGVLTPDHGIRTKNAMAYIESVPTEDDALKAVVNQAIDDFKADYGRYFREQAAAKRIIRENPDLYPVLLFVAGVGLIALGTTRKAACIAADIGEHTVRAKLLANAIGEYEPISEDHVFDMEYWSLQERKVTHSAKPLQGQIALVTGGGGAIGFGIADRLLDAGAAVVLSDIDEFRLETARSLLSEKYDDVARVIFDVTDYHSVEKGFNEITRRFGGLDIVVPNAGIAHVATIEDLEPDKLDQVIAVNLKGTFTVIKASIPVFRRQGTGGNIVLISSKNVFDPGAAFSAYSASKAGAHQMAKIAAMELAELGVRVNMINPDAIFGDEKVCSGLWELVGPDRMKSRGLDPQGLQDYYCQRSLLKQRVLAEHVGNAVVFFASDLTPTTGAALPVDAGNPAAFPR